MGSARHKTRHRKKAAKVPAVLSVRTMGSKGYAIVMLRDQDVYERSIKQKVAVVDGICVEVRRHLCKSEEDAAGSRFGVFVAWGRRVARRVTVSAEGLESYFNGLAGLPWPVGLAPKAPFEERFQEFHIQSERPLPLSFAIREDEAAPARLLAAPHHSAALVEALWEAKELLDQRWARPPPPLARSILQRVARDELFPHSGREKEGKEHENRAGEKLAELAAEVALLSDVPVGAAFLDLCGGPGAWSLFLLGQEELQLRGFGMTLRSTVGEAGDWQAEQKDDWYRELTFRSDWRALWGQDGTGDLLKPGNVEHCAAELRRRGGVFFCLADGGFSDEAIPANLLELYFYRLLLAELLTAASCLQPGGRFVCKLYSTFSTATAALLFLATRLFQTVKVVKPKTSRAAGPERYLVGLGFRRGAETEAIRFALSCSHALGGGRSPLQVPLFSPLVIQEALVKDATFMAQVATMVTTLCQRQTVALHAIAERAELLEAIALEASRSSAIRNWLR